MEISVANRQRKTGISSKHVRLVASSVLEGESACFDEISVAFVSDRAMRRINRTFAGRDESTDTLAFELGPDPTPGGTKTKTVAGKNLGEIIVCVDRAIAQSRTYRVSLEKEVARLLIHGLLHLCGYDDSTKTARARMHSRENRYISSLRKSVAALITSPREGRAPSGSRR
jgi:rRNA maturation RNase YbeY